MAKQDDEFIDSSKISLFALIGRVGLPQLIAAATFVLAFGYTVGKFHSGYIEKKDSDELRNLLAREQQRAGDFEKSVAQCGQTLQTAQGDLTDLRKIASDAQLAKPDNASCEAMVNAERKSIAEKVRKLEAAVTDARNKLEDPGKLETYYVSARAINTDVPQCISKATEAASKMGGTSTRRGDEIHFNVRVDAGFHYCFIGCYAPLEVITCNGPARYSSRGVVNQLASYAW